MANIQAVYFNSLLCAIEINITVTGTDFKYIEIHRSLTNTINSAELIGTTSAERYVDTVELSGEYYYWVRLIDNTDTPLAWFNVNGDYASADLQFNTLLNELQGKINEAQLTDGFLARIEGFILSGKAVDFEELRQDFATVQIALDATQVKYELIHELINTLLAQFGLTEAGLASDLADLAALIAAMNIQFTNTLNGFEISIADQVGDAMASFLIQFDQIVTDVSAMNNLFIGLESSLSNEIASLYASVSDNYSTMVSLTDAIATKTTALEVSFDGLESDTNAALLQESLTRANADSALAQQINSLSASYSGFTSATNASLNEYQLTYTDANLAMAQQITTLDADFTNALNSTIASYDNQILVLTDANQALSTEVTVYTATMQNDIATISSTVSNEVIALANADGALAQSIDSLSAALTSDTDTILASILEEQTARVDADSALASTYTTLSTTVNENNATVQVHASSLNGVQADWGVRTDVNGHVAGLKLINGPDGSDFTVSANTFNIVNPANLNPIFHVDTVNQKVCFTGEVCFGSALDDLTGTAGDPAPGSDGTITENGDPTVPTNNAFMDARGIDLTNAVFKGLYAQGVFYNKNDIVWIQHEIWLDATGTEKYYYSNAYVVAENHTAYTTFDTADGNSYRDRGQTLGLPNSLNGLTSGPT